MIRNGASDLGILGKRDDSRKVSVSANTSQVLDKYLFFRLTAALVIFVLSISFGQSTYVFAETPEEVRPNLKEETESVKTGGEGPNTEIETTQGETQPPLRPKESEISELSTKCDLCAPIVENIRKLWEKQGSIAGGIHLLFQSISGYTLRLRELHQLLGALNNPDLYRGAKGYYSPDFDVIDSMSPALREQALKQIRKDIAANEAKILPVTDQIEKLQGRVKEINGLITDLTKQLEECELECAIVGISSVNIIVGNNPFDPKDPVGGGDGTSRDTIVVIDNIPVDRLNLAAPDACPVYHYHGDAYDCDGVFAPDPAPFVCGHGAATSTIPLSQCPDAQ